MSFSNTQQAGDCVDSSGLLWVNYCPVQLEVQLKGQDSFRGMERRNSMIWVGEAGSGEEKEKEMVNIPYCGRISCSHICFKYTGQKPQQTGAQAHRCF